jgi:uncharacterized membrane protein
VKRYPFLDWTRGLAVLIMIECHVFNSFTGADSRSSGAYMLSQFIGGMAAPLFLFMTGMTLAFQMDSLDRREPRPARRLAGALRRGAYVLALAYAFRLTNYLGGLPHSKPDELLKVDILNCMGVGMLAMAALVMAPPARRAQWATAAGFAVACAAPLVNSLDWSATPYWIRDYIKPNPARFPFFPWVAYLAFGLSTGTVLKRIQPAGVERLMQWGVLAAVPLIFGSWYFSNIPFSLYARSEFWIDSPTLVLIRTGICILLLVGAYLWTEYGAGPGWSWVQVLGKTSLMAYWVHVMLVYGDVSWFFHRALTPAWSATATVAVTAAMVALSAARLRWKERQPSRR